MTDNTQPDALDLANWLDSVGNGGISSTAAAAELRRQHARIAELEADHFEDKLDMVARWYMVDKDGMATLCTDREDAEQEAKDANMAWPHTAPHRAVQLVEVDSIAASAGSEPVVNNRPSLESVFRGLSDRAYCNYIEQMRRNECLGWEHKVKHGTFGEAELKAHTLAGRLLGRHHAFAEAANALRGSNAPLTHPSPPEGMVGGWQDVATAPKGERVLLWSSVKRGEPFIGDWADYMRVNKPRFTHWSRWIPTPTTTSAGSKGE